MPPAASGQRPPPYWTRRRRRNNEIGQLLIRKGIITPQQLREALKIQAESGGHVGAILKRMGACDSRAIAEALIEQVQIAHKKGSGLAQQARKNPSIVGLSVPGRPLLSLALLILSDVVTLALSAALAVFALSGDALTGTQRFSVAAIVPMCIATFAAVALYGTTPPSPPEELRRSTLATLLVYVGSWAVAVLARSGSFSAISHGAWLLGWVVSAFLVPAGRAGLRWQCARRSWWGQPVVVIGAGKVGRAVVATLRNRPQLGLKPVAILDDDPTKHGTVRVTWGEDDLMVQSVREFSPDSIREDFDTPSTRSALEQFAEVEGVPVVGGLELAPILAQRLNIRSIVIAMPKLDSAKLLALIERYADGYSSVLVIPDLFSVAHFGAPTHNLGGVLGIEVQRQLLLAGPRLAKRVMDIALTTLGGLLILPFIAAVAILIKLDSAGPVLYRQRRLGQDGVRFVAFKFRTMHGDGERRLNEVLERDPSLRAEWEEFHKLTQDPRKPDVGNRTIFP